ncbi:precorrin-3B synthase [Krasilnikovia sp. MM14-A1259]|uniref:precorrin-3B synthase n=1 Tax=Krasilnikovia sp. MM14-A1259 TaxID=3373539 RepID=UPI003830A334
MPSPRRVDADACPGALRLHAAADGPLARVRLPGGRLTGAQLQVLRTVAHEWGDGHLELTSRANVQLRALNGVAAERLAGRLAAAGLLPSRTHELVRNIAASPLPGGVLDVAELVGELDRALCADAALAGLPGRFLFALDSGRGDVAFAADVAAYPLDAATDLPDAPAHPSGGTTDVPNAPVDAPRRAADPRGRTVDPRRGTVDPRGGTVAILFAGVDAGLRVPAEEIVPALLAAAHAFLAEREAQRGAGPAWRVGELVDGAGLLAARTAAALGVTLHAPVALDRPEIVPPVGTVEIPDGLVSVAAVVPLGRWDAVQMTVLERAATLVVTPWRGVVVPGLAAAEASGWRRALAGAGLEVEQGARWAGVTACAGRPGCAKSLADVRADATRSVTVSAPAAGLPVHWVGCARGCGSPAGPHVRVEATGRDYAVRSPSGSGRAGVDGVADLVAAARRS